MKILFLPNWDVHKLNQDDPLIQSPNKQVRNQAYWFFRFFKDLPDVTIIDRQKKNILHLFETKALKFYIYQALRAFFNRDNFDIVISHGAQSGLFYSLLRGLSSKKSMPKHIIIDVGGLNGGRTNKAEVAFLRFALKSKPAIIYHSSIQKELYEKVYPKQILNSKFIRFGVNINEFTPMDVDSENYILSFGYAKRDYKTLLSSWRSVESSTKLHIVGDTSLEDQEEVVLIPKVNVFELKQHIAKSLFVVIPLPLFNYSYGQMSFLQSMAMGKCVIVTKTPSSIDYLEEGNGAFFVDPYDELDMTNKINLLLENKDKLKKWGQRARKYIEENLNEEIMAKEIDEFILSIK